MFSALETQIRTHLAGAVPGASIYGTYDPIDLAGPDADRVAVQVEYQGFDALENKPGALTLGHRFATHVLVDTGRARDAERALAETGLQTIIRRLISWPDSTLRCEIQSSPLTSLDARTLRMSVFFSLAPVVMTGA